MKNKLLTFGEKLKSYRIIFGLTEKELAEILGVTEDDLFALKTIFINLLTL